MVRVEDQNITFFHLAKNAGSSIARWLVNNVNGEEYIDEFRHMPPQSLQPLFDNFGWSFCCVRNPWSRYVSWYNFFVNQHNKIGKGLDISFDEFMNRLLEGDITSKYIKNMQGQMPFVESSDYIIRYENLVEDFKVVQKKTNCHVPLIHINRSKPVDYVEYYKKDDYIQWVGDRHCDEVHHFNYSFGG